MRREEEKKRREEEEKHEFIFGFNYAYVPRYELNGDEIKLWKVVTDWGNKIIIWDNALLTGKICSIEDLESGHYHIYDKESGKEIKSSQIPWK